MRLPGAFEERMRERLGPQAESFFSALAEPPRTAVRLHPLKGDKLFPEAERIPWHPLGRLLSHRPFFEEDALWHAGAYYVQEASGMSVRAFLPEKRPLRIMDLSAAPGGKATLLLGELGLEGGLLIANDPDPQRRAALRENLERWGIPAYFITGRHPHYWAKVYPEAFDVVLLDAPCSGEGLWRKDPTAICQWSPRLIRRMQRLQRSLIFAAKALVAPGGRFIYSTCTFAPEENEENLSYAFAEDKAWEPILWESPPSAVQPVPYGNRGIGYYFYPHRGPGEGFFISAWEKKGSPQLRKGSWRSDKSPFPLPKGIISFQREKKTYALTEAAFRLLLPHWERETWEAFPLGSPTQPAHAAALLVLSDGLGFSEKALSDPAEFLAYLQGESFPFQAAIEWTTFAGRGIGWLYKGRPSLPFTWKRFLRHQLRR